uniref:C2H2-type domain-containing protein n=1 Tax=Schistocephalus solidus TaxID=70667 RepID=A0A0X3PMA0_SCHSO
MECRVYCLLELSRLPSWLRWHRLLIFQQESGSNVCEGPDNGDGWQPSSSPLDLSTKSTDRVLPFPIPPSLPKVELNEDGSLAVSTVPASVGTVMEANTLVPEQLTCEACDDVFAEIGSLKRHMDSMHPHLRGYTCKICGKICSKLRSLQNHIDAVHKKLRKYTCEFCGKAFAWKTSLKNHVNVIHRSVRISVCETCGKAFTHSGSLKDHMDVVHKKIRKYTCQLCDKSFGWKGDLNNHVNGIHTRALSILY